MRISNPARYAISASIVLAALTGCGASNAIPAPIAQLGTTEEPATRASYAPVAALISGGLKHPTGSSHGVKRTQANNITWYAAHQYDDGFRPRVSYFAGTVVEVHQAHPGVGPMWYRVGSSPLGQRTVTWGPANQYDQGSLPSVALLDSSEVVEVHQGSSGSLWYHVGTVQGNSIQWGSSQQFDNGTSPTVCGYNNTVVEEHQGAAGAFWSRIGTVQGNTIQFGPAQQHDSGEDPSLGCQYGTGGDVIEVHDGQQAGPGYYGLWFRTGKVVGNAVSWNAASQFDEGAYPVVALSSTQIVSVHQAAAGKVSSLWDDEGSWYGNGRVAWDSPGKYDAGVAPSVSLSGSSEGGYNIVEVHQAGLYSGPLWYRVGSIPANPP